MGRWINWDPIGVLDDVNLYRFVGNSTQGAIDPTGLWKITREGNHRAKAVAESGDTVTTLAAHVRLDSGDYKLWMRDVGGTTAGLPTSVTSTVSIGCQFTVPNTVTVVWGQLSGYDAWWNPVGIYGIFANSISRDMSTFQAAGYQVNEYDSPLASVVEALLQDQNLVAFLFAGHGNSAGDILPQYPQTNSAGQVINATVPENLYRLRSKSLYKIAFMRLLACYSASATSAAAGNPRLGATWSTNVSNSGIFEGYVGSPSFWEMDDPILTGGTGSDFPR